jgi:ABC-type proline/glycine betaine transport system ATPase subunit
VRRELRRWLWRLHDEIPVTSIFVTHDDREEALEVAAHTGTPDGPDVFVRPHEIGIAREDDCRDSLAATVAHIVMTTFTKGICLQLR